MLLKERVCSKKERIYWDLFAQEAPGARIARTIEQKDEAFEKRRLTWVAIARYEGPVGDLDLVYIHNIRKLHNIIVTIRFIIIIIIIILKWRKLVIGIIDERDIKDNGGGIHCRRRVRV